MNLEGVLTLEEVEEALLDCNIERCPQCDYWCLSGELLDIEDNVVGCSSCRITMKE